MKERAEHNKQLLLQEPFDMLDKEVSVTNMQITLPEVPHHKFNLRVYKPRNYDGDPLPIMLYFHGGYWCSGDADAEDFGCRAIIARGTAIIIASFEYRLAPETSWVGIFLDAEYAMKWTAINAGTLGADVARGFLIGGATSGAHLAAICAIRARTKYHSSIELTDQVLIVPITIAWPDENISEEWKKRLRSHESMADAPLPNASLLEYYVDTLGIPDSEKRKGENFPVWADLKNLPPAYIPMEECDPICDEAFLYNELLSEAGVKTRTDFYRGLPNMFVQFPELSTTLIAGIHLAAGVQWLLQERK